MLSRYESRLDDIDVLIEGRLEFGRDTMVLDPAEHAAARQLADSEAAFASGLDVVEHDAAEFDESLGIAGAGDRTVNALAGSTPDASTDSMHAARRARP